MGITITPVPTIRRRINPQVWTYDKERPSIATIRFTLPINSMRNRLGTFYFEHLLNLGDYTHSVKNQG